MWIFPEFVFCCIFVLISLAFFSILVLFFRFTANKDHSSIEIAKMLIENGFCDPSHDSNPMEATFFDCTGQDPSYNINNSIVMEESIKLPTFSIEDLAGHKHPSSEEAAAMTMGLDHLQHQLSIELEHELQNHIDWQPAMQEFGQEATVHHQQNYEHQQQIDAAQENLHSYVDGTLYASHSYGVGSDLLNHLQLPRCTVTPTTNVFPTTTSISFSSSPGLKPGTFSFDACNDLPPPIAMVPDNGAMLYDSSLQLGYPSAPSHLLRDLYHSLPQNYGLFCGVDEREAIVGGVLEGSTSVFQEMDGRHFESSGLDHRREMLGLVKGDQGKAPFTTERQRREQLNEKYKALKSLIPNPTKSDRASIVGDTIEYIRELIRTIKELKILVENKRNGKERRKMQKMEDEAVADVESSSIRPLGDDHDHPLDGGLRSSWLQRRSKESFVDVRIIDDEVNIKLMRKKKANCLLYVAKVLDELQLDLIHVAGGNIGDHYTFMFNTKICGGSSIYASAVAKKILEVIDAQFPPPSFHVLFQD